MTRARKFVLIPLVVAIVGSLLMIGCATPTTTGTSTQPIGTIKEFPIPTAQSGPESITAGPDGNLWFTEDVGNVGRQ